MKVRTRAGHPMVLLLLLAVAPAFADPGLSELVAGTSTTPPLSGLQVSLMKAGEPTASFSLGFAQNAGMNPAALRADHKIRVASISKLVVAIGVMRLVEADRLDLDADVSEYLGWRLRNPAFPDEAITARQLLAHTSSVRDGSRYFIEAGAGELRDFFDPDSSFWDGGDHFAIDRGAHPGRFFVYSNLNFGLLGEVIERLSGQRFDEYMMREVLNPMGLSARFDPCAVPPAQLAAAFRKRPIDGAWDPSGPWVAQVDGGAARCFYGMQDAQHARNFLASYQPGSNASLYSPQGGLRASADELLLVLQMLAKGGVLRGERILSEASVAALLEPEWALNEMRDNGQSAGEAEPGGPTEGLMTSYGLSVHRIDMRAWGFADGPSLLVGHLGEAYGVLSHALFDPQTGDGIATIITGTADDPANSTPGHSPLYRVEEEILNWWLSR
ncbi:MAG: serine hydrolase domain-containing protein [Pseudomonadota bacterium]